MDIQKYTKIANYIDYNSLAVLGTIDDDGTPHGAVVFICADDHRPIVYFITKNGTHKYKNLVARPAVSITIVNSEDSSTLQAKGRASLVQDAVTIDKVSVKITRAHTFADDWLPPIAKLRAGEYTMIAVELTQARLAQYKGKHIGDEGIFTEAL